MIKINAENYFSQEADLEYMSASQFKAFRRCEAAALAEIKGEYEREVTPSLLVGSYVDAHFEGTLDVFKAQHPEIFTRNGELKAEYKKAENIIARIERDELFMDFLSGDKQVIKTGEIEGVPFKIKIDALHSDKIVDLKIMKDFQPVWVEGKGRQNFISAWGYDIQGAIYQAIEGNNLPFYIAAATKEKTTDIEIFEIPQYHLDLAMEEVIQNSMRYQAIKQGIIEPVRCECCDWCRMTKKLTAPVSMEVLDYNE